MKFKDFVQTKSEQNMCLESDSMLLHMMLSLCDEFQNENIKPKLGEVIREKIKYLGEQEIAVSTEQKHLNKKEI